MNDCKGTTVASEWHGYIQLEPICSGSFFTEQMFDPQIFPIRDFIRLLSKVPENLAKTQCAICAPADDNTLMLGGGGESFPELLFECSLVSAALQN